MRLVDALIWVFPQMVVPPFHTPSADHFCRKPPHGFWGKPAILGFETHHLIATAWARGAIWSNFDETLML